MKNRDRYFSTEIETSRSGEKPKNFVVKEIEISH